MSDIECEVCYDDHPDNSAACRRHLTDSQRDLLDGCYALAYERTPLDVLLECVGGPYPAIPADLIAVKRVLLARGVEFSDPEVNAAIGAKS